MTSGIEVRSFLAPGLRSLALGCFCFAWICTSALSSLAASAERGATVFALAGGCGCHSGMSGPIGAGGGEIATPFGKFYGTNITPDPETGIGRWTDEEIEGAIRRGVLRGGEAESPAMPYNWYAGMSDEDVADLIAYLRALPPVKQASKPHEGELPLARWSYRAWQWMFFEAVDAPAKSPASGLERGRYLVDHVSLCADCHTPRTLLGGIDTTGYLGGTLEGPGGKVPNITPHSTGIGEWDAADIVSVLETGMLPNFDNVQGEMARLVDGIAGGPGYKDASEADRRAIADYLLSVPPIDHKVNDD